ncbi:hypothetical protein [Nocardioides sp.]|uniref:hypothetical protein n=1 Tax=Nocardioides sp. TaxID=35761 RepID=UPI002C6BAD98|nr:hypothetical protein [Nocardioides sp.]HXH77392.1 hypothetical protein [Nocardioides sp.]
MRPIAVLTATMTAVLAVGAPVAVQAPALAGEPAEVRWENRMAQQALWSEAIDIAVSIDGATAYAVGTSLADVGDHEAPFVHAVDVATGATRWSTTLDQGMSVLDVEVNATTGQVLIGGTRWSGGQNEAVVTALTTAGEQAWTTAVPGRQLHGMTVDAVTGRVCAASATGTGGTWTTRCWSASGQSVFSRDYRSRSNSWPEAIVIDDVTHRVFVVGARTRNSRALVTTLAYSGGGKTLWRRSTRAEETYPSVQDVAIDSRTKRLYVLLDEGRRAVLIGQRTTDGTQAFKRTFGSGRPKTPRPLFVDVLPRSHRVVVTSHAKPRYRGTLRYLARDGRQVSLTGFSACCDLTRPVVDPTTDHLSIGWGPGTFDDGVPMDDEGVGAATWDTRGNRVRDLEISPAGQVRAVAAITSAGQDLLVFGDRPFSDADGAPRGSFLVAVR